MTVLVRFSCFVLTIAALAGAGCASTDGTSSTSTNGCMEVVPDAGATGLACDLGWSCNADTQRFEIQCVTDADGNYSCDCLSDGTVSRTFKVNPFTCSGLEARSAANAGCGWAIDNS